MPRWTFVRHGQSTANAEGWLAGSIDAPLTERGRAQACALRESLAPLQRWGAVLTSDLRRARDTAAIVFEGVAVPMIATPSLRERTIGRFSGASTDELEPIGGNDLLQQWLGRPPGGESLRDVALRALCWMRAQQGPTPRLVVCHGALMRAVLGLLDDMPRHEIGEFRPGNCEAFTRDVPPAQIDELIDELEGS